MPFLFAMPFDFVTLFTRKSFIQKTKSIFSILRNCLCFFPSDTSDHSGSNLGGQSSTPVATTSVEATFFESRNEESVSLVPETIANDTALVRWSSLNERETYFPFQYLPRDCQLHVFSFLTPKALGRLAGVSSYWKELLEHPSLWKHVDLTMFELRCRCSDPRSCSGECYDLYRSRVRQFIDFVTDIRPNLKSFCFAFDIGDCADDWLDQLNGLLQSVPYHELENATLNWKETPAKPFQSECLTWSGTNFNDLMSRHRRRQRLFSGFFEKFTANATKISRLILPFDWGLKSVQAIGRLKRLEVLTLEKYFIPQPFSQELFDQLLQSAPRLRRLKMSVCVASGAGLVPFRVASRSLQHFDISECQGLCLERADLPNLRTLRTNVRSNYGPLGSCGSGVTTPCLSQVLRDGALKLTTLNGYTLSTNWTADDEQLQSILKNICSCAAHKPIQDSQDTH